MAAGITDKVRLNRVRRMATRQGLFVHKNNERCPWADGYDGYMVYPAAGGPSVFGHDDTKRGQRGSIFTASLADVEAWLIERQPAGSAPSKVLENRVRRAAQRAGLSLRRSRRRDPRSSDYSTYSLLDSVGAVVAGPGDLGLIELTLKAMP